MEAPHAEEIYSPSQLNAEVRMVLEGTFKYVWMTGEISNLSKPSSGHLYFSLKDENAQIRCALFRNSRRGMNFTPENGQHVLLLAQVSLYEARGDFQLIVQRMEMAGEGALQIAFEKLKKRLTAEGLFAEEYKQDLPEFPKCIGVITSSTGAAVRDILIVLKRRFVSIPIIIYPSQVQGDLAAGQLVSAIKKANQRKECDVIILARGGGSLEDLWPFNEEKVARAIFASKIPIVTGVGHEVDFTIADFVADYRAATPSAAAEMVSPNRLEWQQKLHHIQHQLVRIITNELRHIKLDLQHLTKRLKHPGQKLREQAQRLDDMEQRLLRNMQYTLTSNKQRLDELVRALNAVSPLQTLERGYAAITNKRTKQIVQSISDIAINDTITAKLSDGQLECVVTATHKDKP